jgi:hypothetical protein
MNANKKLVAERDSLRAENKQLQLGILEMENLRIENDRLLAILEPCRPDADAQTDPSYPATVNDVLHLLSCYIADFLPDDMVPGDEYYAAWERQARPVIERIMKPTN